MKLLSSVHNAHYRGISCCQSSINISLELFHCVLFLCVLEGEAARDCVWGGQKDSLKF